MAPDPSVRAERPDSVRNALQAERQKARAAERRRREAERAARAAEAELRQERIRRTVTERIAERSAEEADRRAAAETEAVIEELTKRAERAEVALTRLEVALDLGLPREAADRLRGTTREEVERDATDFASLREHVART
jgi:hypothetical protein